MPILLLGHNKRSMDFWQEVYWDNTVEDYAWFLGAVVAALLLQRWVSLLISKIMYLIFKRFDNESVGHSEFERLLNAPLQLIVFLIVFKIGSNHIEFPEAWGLTKPPAFGVILVLEKLYGSILLFAFGFLGFRIVEFLGAIFLARAQKTESKSDDQLVPFLRDILKVFVVLVILLAFMAKIMDVNVAALVAGLGVGGVAIALASKETLENLLGSFTIFLDKPFAVGDMVTIDGITGTVERVGVRSTRIRTLDRSYVTVPNKKLTESNLDNLTLRSQRRGRFMVGLVYSTKAESIKKIVEEIQIYLDQHPETSMDGVVRFYEYGESSLNILVQYFVNTMDWDLYLKIREDINFKIMEIVLRNGSSFAFPSRSLYFENPLNTNQQTS